MKKILLLLVIVSLCAMSMISCSLVDGIVGGVKDDPIKLAKFLQDEKDCDVEILIDEDDLEEVAEGLDIDKDMLVCVVVAEGEDKDMTGAFIFCDKASSAKDAEKCVNDFIEESKEDFNVYVDDLIVECSGKLVFFGFAELWETVK